MSRSTQPSVSELRHKAEMPMIGLSIFMTITAIIGIIIVISTGGSLGSIATAVLFGIVTPVFGVIVIRYMYWSTITNGVEITEKQLPELYEAYVDVATSMGFTADGEGLNRIPRLYLYNGNGTMNAYATKCQVRKGYIVLYSDIVDLAYSHGDFKTLRFVMAHELGHIKCGHVSLWRLMIRPIMRVTKLEPSLTRAQEYTADRAALYYAPEGAMGMISIFAGKHVGQHINLEEYFRSVANHNDGFWLTLANFLSDHAVGFRRMSALLEAQKTDWNVHGRML